MAKKKTTSKGSVPANKQEKKKSGASRIITPEFKLSFPYILRPDDNGKYGCAMIFSKAQLNELKNLIYPLAEQVLRENKHNWSEKKMASVWNKAKPLTQFGLIKDGLDKEYNGYGEGTIFLTARTSMKPGVVDAALNEIDNATDLYPGCICRASLTVFAYDNQGNQGLSLSLQNIQKVRDGEHLGNMVKASDEFEAIGTGDDDDVDSMFD